MAADLLHILRSVGLDEKESALYFAGQAGTSTFIR